MMLWGDIMSTMGGVQYCEVSLKRDGDLRVSIHKNIAALFRPSPFPPVLS